MTPEERARAREADRRAAWRRRPVEPDTVLYESFNGNGALCNPEAIFRGLVADPRFARLTHVWSLSDENDNTAFRDEWSGDRRVRFVEPLSPEYDRALHTAKWLISNATFDRQFTKRPDQVLVNTWHGTPLKKMGFDIGDPASRVANVLRNFLQADVLLSPNPFTTDTLFLDAHRLHGLFEGRILETGYPRIDRQLGGPEVGARARALLAARGLDAGDRRIVLWAPTWKGTSFAKPEDDAESLFAATRDLQRLLDPERHLVLLKTHQVVHRFALAASGPADDVRSFLVPNDIPANVVLAASDALVTDYSSIFVDYLSLDRPIVFFAPDIDDYAGYRGLYLEPGVWPGPVTRDVEATAREILRLGETDDLGDAFRAFRARMAPLDDGRATERVIEAVFAGGEAGAGDGAGRIGEVPRDRTPRPRLLLAVPAAATPERFEEAMALANALDLDALDVSVVLSDSQRRAYRSAQAGFDRRIRQFVRQGELERPRAARFVERLDARLRRTSDHRASGPLRRMWDHEWRRVVGGARFDLVVDLVGTEPFWLTLLLHSGTRTAVWCPADDSTAPSTPKRVLARALREQTDVRFPASPALDTARALERVGILS
ncbi:CDP-glycerol:poly(glycerophosphate) glycerophosphotransferase [Frondihabitans sp. 762G35]|uniref:CDP-glycerol glycerophosphotransferase family protein n=1 Tax=Frondihabitans sp. 762G35 TaxID=1446794 RepID=UPI000D20B546|nr:CDP-glycerol glycerophosphotransferase family protein [Frondihabitans sp. 762G35]ARC57870.1 CDP-glycerol:poly(glycerophosphate) glycerophosphotransferase [Frondihabitans sp. 762G35]